MDTLTNVVERPCVGLVFFVPGLTETLPVNGRAEISTDPEHLKPRGSILVPLAEFGPRLRSVSATLKPPEPLRI